MTIISLEDNFMMNMMIMNWCNLLSLIFFITAIEFSSEINQMSCRRDTMFRLLTRNSKLNVVPIFTKTMEHLSFCTHECLSENACKSFNYNAQSKSCEALSKTRQEAGDDKTKYADGWDYYEQVIYEVRHDASFKASLILLV